MRSSLQLAALLLTIPALACTRPATEPAQLHETHTFPAPAGKLVSVEVQSIDVDVEVVEGETITANLDLEVHSSSRGSARRWIERNTPTFDDSPTRLEVQAPSRGHTVVMFGFLSTDGRLTLKVPSGCRLEVRTSSGDVHLSGEKALAGTVRIDTSSGDVTVRSGAHELIADTASGDVHVSGRDLAVLEADTASGDVRLEDGADRVVVDTASGDVTLRELRGDLSASTSSGEVRASWRTLAAGEAIKVGTSSGDVSLRLPGALAASGELRTGSGTISSELAGSEDERGRRFTFTAPAPAAEAPAGAAQASVAISVRTTSGDITLTRTP